MIQGKGQKAVFEMALPILREINGSIETLLDMMVAWTEKDFNTALSKANRSLEQISQVGEAIKACSIEEGLRQEVYLDELAEVTSLINSFQPFLFSKVQNVPEGT